jgi:16S rRNA (adenine1518-N6/adenine1519-N6)-dimethyltransferase
VDSAIVLIKPNAKKRVKVGDVVKFRNFVRDLYIHRRKNLRGALAGSPRGRREKSDVDAKLKEMGIDGNARGVQTVAHQLSKALVVLDQQDPVHQKLYM